jgi:hypothetical protein
LFPPCYNTGCFELRVYLAEDIDRWVEMAIDLAVVQFVGGATVSPEIKVSLHLLDKWGIVNQDVLKDPDGGVDFLKVVLA